MAIKDGSYDYDFPSPARDPNQDKGKYELRIGAALAHALAQALMFAWCLLEARIAGCLCSLVAALMFGWCLLSAA